MVKSNLPKEREESLIDRFYKPKVEFASANGLAEMFEVVFKEDVGNVLDEVVETHNENDASFVPPCE